MRSWERSKNRYPHRHCVCVFILSYLIAKRFPFFPSSCAGSGQRRRGNGHPAAPDRQYVRVDIQPTAAAAAGTIERRRTPRRHVAETGVRLSRPVERRRSATAPAIDGANKTGSRGPWRGGRRRRRPAVRSLVVPSGPPFADSRGGRIGCTAGFKSPREKGSFRRQLICPLGFALSSASDTRTSPESGCVSSSTDFIQRFLLFSSGFSGSTQFVVRPRRHLFAAALPVDASPGHVGGHVPLHGEDAALDYRFSRWALPAVRPAAAAAASETLSAAHPSGHWTRVSSSPSVRQQRRLPPATGSPRVDLVQ